MDRVILWVRGGVSARGPHAAVLDDSTDALEEGFAMCDADVGGEPTLGAVSVTVSTA